MNDVTDPGLKNGSNQVATLLAFSVLGLLLLIWSTVLPGIGILDLMGKLP